MKRRCVFLDRDGVINAAPPPGEYIRSWDEFHLLPGIEDWIRLFNALGFLVIVVTNQRGIALGIQREPDVEEIHRKMRELLSRAGARIDDVFCCPHHEDACECRKPKTGLVDKARAKWDIDIENSVLIGDSETDRELARRCGMSFIQVSGGRIVSITEAVHRPGASGEPASR